MKDTHPAINGAAEFDHTVIHGGKEAKEDDRGEMANVIYGVQKYGIQKAVSRIRPVIQPPNRARRLSGEQRSASDTVWVRSKGRT